MAALKVVLLMFAVFFAAAYCGGKGKGHMMNYGYQQQQYYPSSNYHSHYHSHYPTYHYPSYHHSPSYGHHSSGYGGHYGMYHGRR